MQRQGEGNSEEREGSQERLGDADAIGNENGNASAEDAPLGGEGGAEDKDAKPQGGGLRMWRAARDRAAWKADVLHVCSCPVLPAPAHRPAQPTQAAQLLSFVYGLLHV